MPHMMTFLSLNQRLDRGDLFFREFFVCLVLGSKFENWNLHTLQFTNMIMARREKQPISYFLPSYCCAFESSNPQARKTTNMSSDRGDETFCFKQKNN